MVEDQPGGGSPSLPWFSQQFRVGSDGWRRGAITKVNQSTGVFFKGINQDQNAFFITYWNVQSINSLTAAFITVRPLIYYIC